MSRSRIRAAGSASLAACLALSLFVSCALTSGCKSGPPTDVVKRALLITKLRKRGLELLTTKIREEDYKYSDPRESKRVLKILAEATECFQESVDLDPFSSSPRLHLARCHYLTGLIHVNNWVVVIERINSQKIRGETPSADLVDDATRYRAESEGFLKKSIREYNYYLTHMMARFPNRGVYDGLFDNYVLLDNYAACAEVLQQLIDNFGSKMRRKDRQYVVGLILKFEEKAALAQPGGA